MFSAEYMQLPTFESSHEDPKNNAPEIQLDHALVNAESVEENHDEVSEDSVAIKGLRSAHLADNNPGSKLTTTETDTNNNVKKQISERVRLRTSVGANIDVATSSSKKLTRKINRSEKLLSERSQLKSELRHLMLRQLPKELYFSKPEIQKRKRIDNIQRKLDKVDRRLNGYIIREKQKDTAFKSGKSSATRLKTGQSRIKNPKDSKSFEHNPSDLLDKIDSLLDSKNILRLKRSIKKDVEARTGLAVAEVLDRDLDESAVSFSEIETKANLEAVARYFGFKSWEDAERRVPSWIIDGVTQMLGLSEEELEAEAMREQEQVERRAPNMRPAELPHDEPIEILRGTEEQEDSPEIDHEESSEIDTRMVEYIHVIAEQNSEIYQSEIEWLAENIEKQLASSLIGAATLAEKRSIIDETYAVNIAFLLDVPKDELKNPAIVPKPLIDKILADINSARQEMKKSQKQKEKPATPTPAPKKPKAAPVKRETISSSSKREVTEQERNAGSSLEALRNIIND